MKCEPIKTGEPNHLGWHKHKCRHCGTVFPPSPTPPIKECEATTKSHAKSPSVHTAAGLSRLAVVTTFFDLHASEVRLANYYTFARCMERFHIDLYTVEGVAPGQSPRLSNRPKHTWYECRDRLWHKERLLNLGIASLPPEIDAVGWFDCDLVFRLGAKCGCSNGLRGAILNALNRWPVIQPWSVAEFLDEDGSHICWGNNIRWAKSMSAKNLELPVSKRKTIPSWAHPGYAWAARRETLDAIGGLFDLHPLGGQDSMMTCGFYGQFDSPYLKQYSTAMLDAWRPWSKKAWDAVAGNVGFVDARVSHLWHGSKDSRQYGNRNREIGELGCDPRKHMLTADNGTLVWGPDTPTQVIEYCNRYFESREKRWDSTRSEQTRSITV